MVHCLSILSNKREISQNKSRPNTRVYAMTCCLVSLRVRRGALIGQSKLLKTIHIDLFRSDRHSEHLSIITQIKFPNHSATVTKCKTSAKPGTSTRPVFSIYPIQDSGFYNWCAGAVSRVICSVRYKMRLRQSDSMDCSDGEIHMYDTEDMASSPGSSELDKYACTVMKVRRF